MWIVMKLLIYPWMVMIVILSLGTLVNVQSRARTVKQHPKAEWKSLVNYFGLWLVNTFLEAFAALILIYGRILNSLWLYTRIRPARARALDNQQPLFILVHGYWDAPFSFWYLKKRLHPVHRGNVLELALLPKHASISALAAQLSQAIQAQQHPGPYIYIGHSMGGLISSFCNENHDIKAAQLIITLGSPLNGTLWARCGIGENAKEMRVGSPLLATLCGAMRANQKTQYYHIATSFDLIIEPWKSALLWEPSDARFSTHQAIVNKGGHVALLYSNEVVSLIAERIKSL